MLHGDVDGDAEVAVRRHHLFDQRRQRHAVERLAGREFRQLGQDVAAALRLLAQQPHVVHMRRVRLQRQLQLLDDHRNGRERRAELVGGRGRKPVELRQMLLAREHELGRGQRLGDLPALFGDLPGIDADEADREQDRKPDAQQIDPGQFERIVGVPRQRIMREHQHGRAYHGEHAEDDGDARRQRGRRQQHGRQEQKREWIFQPAGQEQKHRKLGDVESEQPRRALGLEPLGQAEPHPQRDVQPGRQRDHREAGPDRQREFDRVIDHQHGDGLPDDGKPAQPQQRVETHVSPLRQVQYVGGIVEHGVILVRLGLFSMLRRDAWPAVAGLGLAPGRAPRHICGVMLAPATSSPIAVDRLVKRYKSVTAVDGISFSIEAGSCAALLGGNGAGKTTTISTIMGLVEPTDGKVTVLGAAMPRQRHRVLHRMNFESPYVNMPMRLTVRQNLNVFGMLYGCEDVAGRIRALADEFDMHAFLDRETGKLSSGQKTRVALAKSLINQPEILLLDEPTASLDPDTADWVRGRLERYRRERGATVLLASHNMNEVERLCDRVIMLKTGRIEDDDTPARLIARYGRSNLEEVFLDIARGTGEAREAAR